ncbi:MFS transporter [Sesbania bispinosa]|nr:MFS transporter [Sesbania bispinosa]
MASNLEVAQRGVVAQRHDATVVTGVKFPFFVLDIMLCHSNDEEGLQHRDKAVTLAGQGGG